MPGVAASVAKSDHLHRLAGLATDGATAVGGKDRRAGVRLAERGGFFAFVAGETDGIVERWRERREWTAVRG